MRRAVLFAAGCCFAGAGISSECLSRELTVRTERQSPPTALQSFRPLVGLAHKANPAPNARATAVFGKCTDTAGGETSFCEGGRFEATLGKGDHGSAYGLICAAGTEARHVTNPDYLIGCEGEIDKEVGFDAPTYASFDRDSFAASFVATNGVGSGTRREVDAMIVANPYSLAEFRTGVLLTRAVNDTGVAATPNTTLENGIDLHLATIRYSALWMPGGVPIRAGPSGLRIFALDQSKNLAIGSDITGLVTIGSVLSLKGYKVAALPPCTSELKGGLAHVTDLTEIAYNVPPVGGGALDAPVYCDGMSWRIH